MRGWIQAGLFFTLVAVGVACAESAPVGEVESNQTEEEGTDTEFGKNAKPPAEGTRSGDTRAPAEATDAAAPTGTGKDWSGCAADGDCASAWCGCAYASEKVCLPSKTFPKDCSAGPDGGAPRDAGGARDAGGGTTGASVGAACTDNAACSTKLCGCFGSAKKICLPSGTQPTACK